MAYDDFHHILEDISVGGKLHGYNHSHSSVPTDYT